MTTTQETTPNRAPPGALVVSGGWQLRGHKGGSETPRQPIEAPDSLHNTSFYKIVDIVSEGEIYGPVHAEQPLRDVLLNGTPVENEDGTRNFEGIEIGFRSGTQFQDPLPGFPASESATMIGVELKAGTPWVRSFTNPNLSAVRVTLAVPALNRRDPDNNDLVGYRVDYVIEVQTDGGEYREAVVGAFDGKAVNRYERSHRVDLPKATTGWLVRVRRLTANANSTLIADATVVSAVTEIIDARLRRPMTALFGLTINAQNFPNGVPDRAYLLRGRIVRVPSNYDPATRTYTGVWDGTFKAAWTNCPPWILYDMISNDRYGLGAKIPAAKLARLKWTLYPIAQYCDELVPNGFGAMEPRFTCNVYMQQAADAFRVLQDLAGVFRGLAYEAEGAVMVSADMPGDPVYTFSAANVIDGRFEYSGTPLETRYSTARASYNDMTDMGRQKVEAVIDEEAQTRFGFRATEVAAFGCTSRAQAVRVGKWMLLTSQRETESVTFGVGLDHALVQPGKVVRVVNPRRAGRRVGGRIHAATADLVTVDMEVGVRPGDRLVVNLPSGVSEARVVKVAVGRAITADSTVLTADSTKITADMIGLREAQLHIEVSPPFSEVPEAEAIWTVESETLSSQLFRIMSVARSGPMTAQITAIAHQPGKFAAVDYGTKLEFPPITVVPPSVQPPPTGVTLTSFATVDQGVASRNASIAWEPSERAVSYEVEWKRDNSGWVRAGRVGGTNLVLRGIYAGEYVARVYAVNAADIPSVWATSVQTYLDGNMSPPPMVTNLLANGLVFGIQLAWGFAEGPNTIGRTEIWYSSSNDRSTAVKLTDLAYPQNSYSMAGLGGGVRFYFWARLVDRNGLDGEFYPGNQGVMGQSSDDASLILQYLKGEISRDQFAQSLIQEIDGLRDGLDENSTKITNERTERVNAVGALASTVDTVKATANQSAAAVQVTSEALAGLNGSLSATWSVRAQVNSHGQVYMAGMGAGVYDTGHGIQTSVYFLADRFAFLNVANGAISTPFVIENGQTFINQAFIGKGWITNLMIGDTISSNNYVANQTGWLLDKAGNFYNNGSGAGGRRVDTSTTTRIYYPNGQIAVAMGIDI